MEPACVASWSAQQITKLFQLRKSILGKAQWILIHAAQPWNIFLFPDSPDWSKEGRYSDPVEQLLH